MTWPPIVEAVGTGLTGFSAAVAGIFAARYAWKCDLHIAGDATNAGGINLLLIRVTLRSGSLQRLQLAKTDGKPGGPDETTDDDGHAGLVDRASKALAVEVLSTTSGTLKLGRRRENSEVFREGEKLEPGETIATTVLLPFATHSDSPAPPPATSGAGSSATVARAPSTRGRVPHGAVSLPRRPTAEPTEGASLLGYRAAVEVAIRVPGFRYWQGSYRVYADQVFIPAPTAKI